MSHLQEILRRLPLITAEERKKVRLRLKVLDGLEPVKTSDSPIDDWLLEGIFSELNRRGIMTGRVPEKRVRQIAPQFTFESARVRALVLHRVYPRPTYAQLLALGRISARALADYLSSWMTVGLQQLLTNTGKVPEALDASYPDYLSSGLVVYLLNSGNSS